MKKALIIYWSHTGNTEKVARAAEAGLRDAGWDVKLLPMEEAEAEDYYAYDLICCGAPSYNWNIPAPANKCLRAKFAEYKAKGRVVPSAPKLPGKHALIFCTYSGPHTGMNEAVPAGKYMGQFFEHFGFTIADEWYILSEFVGSPENNTLGRMGDIRGLPDERELARIRSAAANLGNRLEVFEG